MSPAATRFQLRDYTVKPGQMADWQREWAAAIRPLREKFGFRVIGAWAIEPDRFVWILEYAGPGAFDDAEAAYYASPERAAVDPNPARHIASTQHWKMAPV